MAIGTTPDRRPATIPLSIARSIREQRVRPPEEREEDREQARRLRQQDEFRAQTSNRVMAHLAEATRSMQEADQIRDARRQDVQGRLQGQYDRDAQRLEGLYDKFIPDRPSASYLQAASNRPEIPLEEVEERARSAEGFANLQRFTRESQNLDATGQGDLIRLSAGLTKEGITGEQFKDTLEAMKAGRLDAIPLDLQEKSRKIAEGLGEPELFTQAGISAIPTPIPTAPQQVLPSPTPPREVTIGPRAEPPIPTGTPTPTEPVPIRPPDPTQRKEGLAGVAEAFAPTVGLTIPDPVTGEERPLAEEERAQAGGQIAQEFFQLLQQPEVLESVQRIRSALDGEGVTPEQFIRVVDEVAARPNISLPGEQTLASPEQIAAETAEFAQFLEEQGLGPAFRALSQIEPVPEITTEGAFPQAFRLDGAYPYVRSGRPEDLIMDLIMYGSIPTTILKTILDAGDAVARGEPIEALTEVGIGAGVVGANVLARTIMAIRAGAPARTAFREAFTETPSALLPSFGETAAAVEGGRAAVTFGSRAGGGRPVVRGAPLEEAIPVTRPVGEVPGAVAGVAAEAPGAIRTIQRIGPAAWRKGTERLIARKSSPNVVFGKATRTTDQFVEVTERGTGRKSRLPWSEVIRVEETVGPAAVGAARPVPAVRRVAPEAQAAVDDAMARLPTEIQQNVAKHVNSVRVSRAEVLAEEGGRLVQETGDVLLHADEVADNALHELLHAHVLHMDDSPFVQSYIRTRYPAANVERFVAKQESSGVGWPTYSPLAQEDLTTSLTAYFGGRAESLKPEVRALFDRRFGGVRAEVGRAAGAARPVGGITPEAEEVLRTVEAGGVPAFVSGRLERIARANAVDPMGKTPNQIISELKVRAGGRAAPEAVPAAREVPKTTVGEVERGADIVYSSQEPETVGEILAGTRSRPVWAGAEPTQGFVKNTGVADSEVIAFRVRPGAKPIKTSGNAAQFKAEDLEPVGRFPMKDVFDEDTIRLAVPLRAETAGGKVAIEKNFRPEETITRLKDRLTKSRRVRVAGEEVRGAERRARANQLKKVLDDTNLDPVTKTKRAKATLAGSLPTIREFEALGTTADRDFVELNRILDDFFKARPGRSFDQLNARDALETVWLGGNPIESQRKLLGEVFGADIGKALFQRLPAGTQLGREAVALLNVPRMLLATWDFSMPFRQAIIQSFAHPAMSAKAAGKTIRLLRDPAARARTNRWLKEGPEAQFALDHGLEVTVGRGGEEFGRAVVEETRIGTWIRKLPGIRVSEEGAAYYLSISRRQLWDQEIARLKLLGINRSREELRNVAEFINVTTGRGRLGPIEQYVPAFNQIFFSMRLNAARIKTPFFLFKGETRRMAARDLSRFLIGGIGILGAAKASGLADVEIDPRSTDFGKLRIGPTRIDFWGGFQPMARYAAQILSGDRKTALGDIQDISSVPDVASQFIRSKLAPTAGLATDVITGRTFLGDKLSFDPPDLPEQIEDRLMPLFLQDLFEATREQGALGFALALPGFGGVNIASYTPLSVEAKTLIAEDYQQALLQDFYPGIPDRLSALSPRDDAEFAERHPDFSRRLEEDEQERAARGDPLARVFQQAEESAQAKHDAIQSSSDRFQQGSITPSQFREEVSDAMLLDRGSREMVTLMLESLDVETKPPSLTLLEDYFSIFDKFPDTDTNVGERDAMFEEIEQFRGRLTLAQERVLDSNIGVALRDIPVYQEFLDDKRVIRESGWWDIPDNAWAMILNRFPNEGLPPSADDYRRQRTQELEEEVGLAGSDFFLNRDPVMRAFTDAMDLVRTRWRVAHPDVMLLLTKWDYATVPKRFIPAVSQQQS